MKLLKKLTSKPDPRWVKARNWFSAAATALAALLFFIQSLEGPDLDVPSIVSKVIAVLAIICATVGTVAQLTTPPEQQPPPPQQ